MGARLAVVIAAVVGLSACAAVPPAGPTAEEVADYNQRMLQATWINTGLSEVFARPEVPQGAALSQEDWFTAVFECMSTKGYGGYGIGYGYGQGASIGSSSGEKVTDAAVQLAFYGCAAAHPTDVVASQELMSPAQIDFIYDYYQEWVVPCMVAQGFTVRDPPTRQAFHEGFGQWSPYWSVRNSRAGTEVEDLQQVCGPNRPELP